MSANEKCGEVAPVRVFWPAKEPMSMCLDHATMAKRIADAMGFHLPMEPQGGIHTCEHAKENAS